MLNAKYKINAFRCMEEEDYFILCLGGSAVQFMLQRSHSAFSFSSHDTLIVTENEEIY